MKGVSSSFKSRIRRDYQNILTGENGLMSGAAEQVHAYAAPISGYYWGSNSVKSRRGSVFTQAAQAKMHGASQDDYRNAGLAYLNYLHGVNPLGLVYLTNMERYGAEKSVSEIYHNWFVNGSKEYDSTKTSTYGPCLLYTSPSPRDGLLSRMPSSA